MIDHPLLLALIAAVVAASIWSFRPRRRKDRATPQIELPQPAFNDDDDARRLRVTLLALLIGRELDLSEHHLDELRVLTTSGVVPAHAAGDLTRLTITAHVVALAESWDALTAAETAPLAPAHALELVGDPLAHSGEIDAQVLAALHRVVERDPWMFGLSEPVRESPGES